MSPTTTWELWASRYEDGELWNVGEQSWVKNWVQLHQLLIPVVPVLAEEMPGVPVLVEEMPGDLFAPEITHYGWRYTEGNLYRHSDKPVMIYPRAESDPSNPQRALMGLDLHFPGSLDHAITRGDGSIVPLRITERHEKTSARRYFLLDDGGVYYYVVANNAEHAEQVLRDAGIEFSAEGLPYDHAKRHNLLSWKEINVERASALRVHLNEGSADDPTPLVQCEIGDWFCSEW